MQENPTRLPAIVFSSVVRSTQQLESHGGVYLLDLETEQLTQMIDWDDQTIDLSQRGGDRGLRGIAFWDDRMYLAAADEIFVYDPGFRLVGSIKIPYLRHCHEINTGGGKLFLGSVGYDTILEYDIAEERFSAGYCIRYSPLRRKLRRKNREGFQFRPRPTLTVFDPNGDQVGRVRDAVARIRPEGAPPRVVGLIAELALRRLIGVGCRPDGDMFAPDVFLVQIALGERSCVLLHVDL